MVLDPKDRVWVGRRRSGVGVIETTAWQMPQGGIDAGEEPLAAAKRELYEETNIRSIELLDQTRDWLVYDLPEHLVGQLWGGKYRGQKQKWFAFRFTGEPDEIDIHTPGGGVFAPEFEAWRWEAMARLPQVIVPFKSDVYKQVVAAFSHLVAS